MNIQNWLLTFQGQNIQELGNLTGQAVTGTSLPYIIELAKEYGREVGVGGYLIGRRDLL